MLTNTGETRLMIEGPEGHLETIVHRPEHSQPVVGIVCHPHPLHGGTMNNKVVTTLCRALRQLDVPSVRFNYHGVGASDGESEGGMSEVEDLKAVWQWVESEFPGAAIWLMGFSFGTFVSLYAAQTLKPAAVISVAPVVSYEVFQTIEPPACPWWIVAADQDELIDAAAIDQWAAGFSPAPAVSHFPEAGHFFHGHLVELRQQAEAFLKAQLPG